MDAPPPSAPPAPPPLPGLDATRLFVVCGKNVDSTTLDTLFRPHGDIASIKLVRDKGVAYVRYARASAAAAAVEALHDTQLTPGDAASPTLRVLLADPPAGKKVVVDGGSTRSGGAPPAPARPLPPPPPSNDPDDHPPRSRVFLVVPRAADPGALAAALASLAPPASLAWFKGDLVGAKGVCYAKFHTASSALTALEAIADAGGLLAGVRVKGMLAEPRSARAGASGGGGGSAVVAATAAAGAAAASASTSTAAAAPSASAPVASGASWDGAAAASRGSGAPDASTSSRRSGRGRRRRGRRGAGGGGAAAAAEDGGDDPPALSLPALHALAAMRGGLGPLGGRGWGADAAPSSLFSDGARPPPAPAAAASARTAPSPSPSSDSVQPASDDEDVAVGQPPGQPPPPPRASRRRRAATSATSAAAATAADVAAVREGLAHMRTADDDADVGLAALGLGGGGDDDDAAAPVAPPPNRTIYTTLTRPLPAYALEHVLSAHGALVSVALRPSAPRHAVAVFADARAARAARDALDGSRVLGERLSVALVDPLVEGGASVPLTKRQRVGGGVVE